MTMTAKTSKSLMTQAKETQTRLAASPAACVSDICHTANTFRQKFEQRVVFMVDSENSEALLSKIDSFVTQKKDSYLVGSSAKQPKTAFFFPNELFTECALAECLCQDVSAFSAAVDECAAVLDAYLSQPLAGLLTAVTEDSSPEDISACTFVIEYALAKIWMSWGVIPGAVCGEGVGELVALHMCGSLTLSDALLFTHRRAQPHPRHRQHLRDRIRLLRHRRLSATPRHRGCTGGRRWWLLPG
jgi:acyl transferase domain-containing protein